MVMLPENIVLFQMGADDRIVKAAGLIGGSPRAFSDFVNSENALRFFELSAF
ncbi:hypothetical protein ACUSIJ_09890 [Pseudochelatococcus sp. B33]